MRRCPDPDEVDEVDAASAFRTCPDSDEVDEVDATGALQSVEHALKLREGSGDIPIFSFPGHDSGGGGGSKSRLSR